MVGEKRVSFSRKRTFLTFTFQPIFSSFFLVFLFLHSILTNSNTPTLPLHFFRSPYLNWWDEPTAFEMSCLVGAEDIRGSELFSDQVLRLSRMHSYFFRHSSILHPFSLLTLCSLPFFQHHFYLRLQSSHFLSGYQDPYQVAFLPCSDGKGSVDMWWKTAQKFRLVK